jgi:23S rRNA (cytosine1962-C5)-methyltransferase
LAQADAFDWLRESTTRKFDLVVLDPPSFAKRETEREGAIRAYGRLTNLGIERLSPGGVLVACSCSAHVSAAEFFDSVRRSTTKSGRKFREVQTTQHAPDHPAAFKEAEYLKAILLRF